MASSKSNTNKPARQKKTLDDYEFLINENSRVKTSDLGKGSYGSVKKAKEKKTGEVFAIKILSKKSIFQYATKENLKREITIQKSITHPNIVKLYHYFEDKENVYLVLEFAENGSLFQYLRKKRKLTEKEAFIYFLQTCLGIDYLHKRKILHRDLKPENLLLDKDNNIKLCDFGWSAENPNDKRHTFCGTVDYMAPEMVKNQPYDHKLDIWCLGILLYELLHGDAPFKGKSDQEKCRNIAQNASFEFGPDVSSDVADLIKKILKPKPADRLSMDGIFSHRWMKKFELEYNVEIQSLVREQDELAMQAQSNLQKAEKARAEKVDDSVNSTKLEDSFSTDVTEKTTEYNIGNGKPGKFGATAEDLYSQVVNNEKKGKQESKQKYEYDPFETGYSKSDVQNKKEDTTDKYNYGQAYKTNSKSGNYDYQSQSQSKSKSGDPYSLDSYSKKPADYGSSNSKLGESSYSSDYYTQKNKENEKLGQSSSSNVFYKFLNTAPTSYDYSTTAAEETNNWNIRKPNPPSSQIPETKPKVEIEKDPLKSYEEAYDSYFKNKEVLQQEKIKKSGLPSSYQESKMNQNTSEKPAWQENKVTQDYKSYDKPAWQDSKPYEESKPSQYSWEKSTWQDSNTISTDKPSYNQYGYEQARDDDSSYKKPTLYVNKTSTNQDDIQEYLAKTNLLYKKQTFGFEDLAVSNKPYYEPTVSKGYQDNYDYRSRDYGERDYRGNDYMQKDYNHNSSFDRHNSRRGEREKKAGNYGHYKSKYHDVGEEEEEYDEYEQAKAHHRREYRKQKGKTQRSRSRSHPKEEPNFVQKILIRLGCISRSKDEE